MEPKNKIGVKHEGEPTGISPGMFRYSNKLNKMQVQLYRSAALNAMSQLRKETTPKTRSFSS